MNDHTTHDPTPCKRCTKCGETKPATTEYFHRDKRHSSGLRADCKACMAAYDRARYVTTRDRDRERKRAYLEANKERYRSYREANKERIREYTRAYNEANKERRRAYTAATKEQRRAYLEANRERTRERRRTYREANRERIRAYYEANRESIGEQKHAYYETNKDRTLERNRKWRAANPAATRAMKQRRRARLANAEGTHTAADVQAQYKAQRGKCYYCKTKLGKKGWHVDHVVPLSRGGSNWPENIVISCESCNKAKGSKLPSEWPEGGRLL